jgi:hypothetical protein
MTNILGKIAQTLGLDGEDRNTNAAAAGNGGATEAGGAAGTGGLSMGGGVGGTPDDLAVGAAAAAADTVAQSTGGTDPITPGQGPDHFAERSHDIGGGSGAD